MAHLTDATHAGVKTVAFSTVNVQEGFTYAGRIRPHWSQEAMPCGEQVSVLSTLEQYDSVESYITQNDASNQGLPVMYGAS